MKLIAKKDFRNVASLGLKDENKEEGKQSLVKDAVHDNHIHKGAIIEIGAERNTTLEMLRQKEPVNAAIVAQLIVAGCVGITEGPEGEKLVKEINAEVETEKKRLAAASKSDVMAANAELGDKMKKALTSK